MGPLNDGMFAYHEATKHTVERLRRSRHFLDWANMPNPFRNYEGTPVLDLPADPPFPEIPALDALRGKRGSSAAGGTAFLSRLLYYAASISASKRAPSGQRYALRVNPSSGNLHPTEFHFASQGLQGWPDGLYHYRASAHMAEQRGTGSFLRVLPVHAPLVFILTSIFWREAWKYRDRAYRYCLHDAGHAAESLMLCARALGCEATLVQDFPDDAIARIIGVEDEAPLLLIGMTGMPVEGRPEREPVLAGGTANILSREYISYPLIEEMHQATKRATTIAPSASSPSEADVPGEACLIPLRPTSVSGDPFGVVVRRRRSALDFVGGDRSISFEQFSTLCAESLPRDSRYIRHYIFVHRVDELEQGVYHYWPESRAVELLKAGDQRVIAAGLSLSQDLAGNSCVTFSMAADLQRAFREHGDRGYRYVIVEAGRIGQRLYIAAEALGFQSTGIGAFYDDEVHRYLEIKPEQEQVVYHFACGYAVKDERLDS